jgi:hypothetical protein
MTSARTKLKHELPHVNSLAVLTQWALKHGIAKWVVAVMLVAGFGAYALLPTSPSTVTIGWNPIPASDLTPDCVVKLYYSQQVDAPVAEWTVLTNLPATNTQVKVTVAPGRFFFFLTASNWTGESFPSNTAPMRDLNGVKIKADQ